jgi:hypothetical protein
MLCKRGRVLIWVGEGLPVIACEWSAGRAAMLVWWREKSVAAAEYITKREI